MRLFLHITISVLLVVAGIFLIAHGSSYGLELGLTCFVFSAFHHLFWD